MKLTPIRIPFLTRSRSPRHYTKSKKLLRRAKKKTAIWGKKNPDRTKKKPRADTGKKTKKLQRSARKVHLYQVSQSRQRQYVQYTSKGEGISTPNGTEARSRRHRTRDHEHERNRKDGRKQSPSPRPLEWIRGRVSGDWFRERVSGERSRGRVSGGRFWGSVSGGQFWKRVCKYRKIGFGVGYY